MPNTMPIVSRSADAHPRESRYLGGSPGTNSSGLRFQSRSQRRCGMTLKPQFFVLKLMTPSGKKGRVWHLALSNETGHAPLLVTFCHQSYDSGDRRDASKGLKPISGMECQECLRTLGTNHSQLCQLYRQSGCSEEEAIAAADYILQLQRSSK